MLTAAPAHISLSTDGEFMRVECDSLQLANSTIQAEAISLQVQTLATIDPTSSVLFGTQANMTFHGGATIAVRFVSLGSLFFARIELN